jgi:serine/threonine protein kinase
VDLAIGTVLAGKYRVDRLLGEGGMGVVVAATHVALKQPVAL